jgi:MoxR-like ATPase
MQIEEKVSKFNQGFVKLKDEIAKNIVGQSEVVDGVIICLIANGHALLEGVPGLGKTLLVRTLSEAADLDFNRIQFTPDLMPADIVGTNIIAESETGKRDFKFQHGPIFANIILADEINRATPKTQSALLEAMQERSVTVAGTIRKLQEPFIVMATQNPLEMEGTYPLPEAQLDRFMFKLKVDFPSIDELSVIVDRTTTNEKTAINKIIDAEEIIEMRDLAKDVPIAPHVKEYALKTVLATHPSGDYASDMTNRYVRYGASPRGAQSIILGAKVKALLDGRFNVSFDDIINIAKPALRHRIILNFEGEAEQIGADAIIDDIIAKHAVKDTISV